MPRHILENSFFNTLLLIHPKRLLLRLVIALLIVPTPKDYSMDLISKSSPNT